MGWGTYTAYKSQIWSRVINSANSYCTIRHWYVESLSSGGICGYQNDRNYTDLYYTGRWHTLFNRICWAVDSGSQPLIDGAVRLSFYQEYTNNNLYAFRNLSNKLYSSSIWVCVVRFRWWCCDDEPYNLFFWTRAELTEFRISVKPINYWLLYLTPISTWDLIFISIMSLAYRLRYQS